MAKEKKNANRDDGSYITRRSGKSNFLAFLLCLLLAAFIWVYSENVTMHDSSSDVDSDAPSVTQTV